MDFSVFYRKLLAPVVSLLGHTVFVLVIVWCALVFYSFFKYQWNPLGRMTPLKLRDLRELPIRLKPLSFFRWMMVDKVYTKPDRDLFNQFGLTLFCGRQGSGKSVSMVHYGAWVRQRFPKCLIGANFACSFADFRMEDWHDFMDIRNGTDGVLFMIDEIHSEYSSASWKDFPEELLSEISQQRKQRVKIVATSQVFTRVAKPIREQCFSVVQCSTLGGRWTFNKEYDALDYQLYCESTSRKKKLKPFRKKSFVQSDALRNCYDTYEKIKRLSKAEFIPRAERGTGERS